MAHISWLRHLGHHLILIHIITTCRLILSPSVAGTIEASSLAGERDGTSQEVPSCASMFKIEGVMSSSDPACKPDAYENVYFNLPLLDGVYCFNNGTGVCKAFSGRFEFFFNVWNQEFLGPAPASEDVNSQGYHKRVPHAYTPEGQILYSDRAINWSLQFTRNNKLVPVYNLLSATSFNWCEYATTNNWPYKSSILDHDQVHQIYFFNRQSCIYNPRTGAIQHYNTRFLHTSKLRIDLEYNPTIFAMEDNLAHETRLVKHKRQHWYELGWKLLKSPREDIMYFVEMETEERRPLIMDGRGPLLRAQMYNKTTGVCVSDYLASRRDSLGSKNSRLVSSRCGVDQGEIALHFRFGNMDNNSQYDELYDVGLHSIPRFPQESQQFYGVNITNDTDWETFARDGYSFSATTTIPLGNDTFEVISLLSYYKGQQPADTYDEQYPPTYLLRYNMSHTTNELDGHKWTGIENRNIAKAKPLLNLNYVDDIAHLPKCNTILVIFGPLYTEFPIDEFNLNKRTPLGSIHDLGANEMIQAFFAIDNKLYFYHRVNYVAEHTYTCGAGSIDRPLVTATRNGPYRFRNGPGRFEFMPSKNDLYNHYEERHFQLIGMFKGQIGSPEAPDASKFHWDPQDSQIVAPDFRGPPSSIYWLIGLAALGLLLMFGGACFAFRNQTRRRRRRLLLKTQRSEIADVSQVSALKTNRSALMPGASGASALSNAVTVRGSNLGNVASTPSSTTSTHGGGGGGSRQPSTVTGRDTIKLRPNSPRPSDTGTTRSSNIMSTMPASPRKSKASQSSSQRRIALSPRSPLSES